MSSAETLFSQAAEAIAKADGLLVTAGAGMGVDSGLPDFRGSEGFWNAYPALARARIGFTSIANPAAFESNPRRAWGFYGHRLQLYRETVPHAGFGILKTLSNEMEHGAFVFTSNVDGQFQKAGFNPRRVVEAHGSIHHLQCQNGCLGDI
jgi:NAD-dependent SIR2 family protein deacetylase